MPLSTSGHTHMIADLPTLALRWQKSVEEPTAPHRKSHCQSGPLAEVPLPHHAPRTTETPHRILELRGNSSPRSDWDINPGLKRVGASPHPPPHTTPRHHLKAHGASPLPPLDSPRIRVCFAVESAIVPPSHSKNPTFAVPPPESQLHHMCKFKAFRDTAHHLYLGRIGTSTLTTTLAAPPPTATPTLPQT